MFSCKTSNYSTHMYILTVSILLKKSSSISEIMAFKFGCKYSFFIMYLNFAYIFGNFTVFRTSIFRKLVINLFNWKASVTDYVVVCHSLWSKQKSPQFRDHISMLERRTLPSLLLIERKPRLRCIRHRVDVNGGRKTSPLTYKSSIVTLIMILPVCLCFIKGQ